MPSVYNPWLVVLSLLVAVLVSYTALRLASRVARSAHQEARIWLGIGAITMGVGIWSMHFIGMLAYSVPITLAYHIPTTVASLAVAIVTSGFALAITSGQHLTVGRIGASAVAMGAGISTMHYLGMAAIAVVPGISYDPLLVAVSVVIAVGASFAALWLSFRLRDGSSLYQWLTRIAAAAVMGLAISGMHYIGMAASRFAVGSYCSGGVIIQDNWFAVTIGMFALGLLVTTLVTAVYDSHLQERKRFEIELSRRASHDELTDLPNRTLIAEIVKNAVNTIPRGEMFALAFIDIDNFKQVNDYYSHTFGDALLIAVAQRIRQTIRSVDTLARISGDEFLLLVNPLERPEYLSPLIDRVVDSLKQPFTIEGHEVLTSASVGSSIYPLHGDSYETLRRCADSAMYRAKQHRKGSASYFDVAVDGGLTARMAIEQQLRVAIRERHFRTAFQPKVDLHSARVAGFEALARWVEPDGKVRMPAEFIDLAGDIGVLDDITRFVLGDVAESLPVLTRSYGPHISVSLNIGAKQAGDATFMQSFIEQLTAAGIGRRLVIELTEDALVATQQFERELLPELRRLGVRVSIDDFGTGYSSLSTLADITADEVKVDRAFITDIHERVRSQGILKAIESLCSALDVSVVAEGVETAEELAYLQTHTSIRFGQGYFFSKPMFLHELAVDAADALDEALKRARDQTASAGSPR